MLTYKGVFNLQVCTKVVIFNAITKVQKKTFCPGVTKKSLGVAHLLRDLGLKPRSIGVSPRADSPVVKAVAILALFRVFGFLIGLDLLVGPHFSIKS